MIYKIFYLKHIIYTFLLLASPCLLAQDDVLDNTFGNNGIVITDFNNLSDTSAAMTAQDDGKIVVVGQNEVAGNGEAIVIRYNEDGSLDNTFGTNGVATTPILKDKLTAVKVQSDGKIVVGGYTNGLDFLIMRYTANGQLDTSFGTGGVVITDYYNTREPHAGASVSLVSY